MIMGLGKTIKTKCWTPAIIAVVDISVISVEG